MEPLALVGGDFSVCRLTNPVFWCMNRYEMQKERKEGEKANTDSVEVNRCRHSAQHCTGMRLPHGLSAVSPSALLLAALMTSLNHRLQEDPVRLIFTVYCPFAALFRLPSAWAK